MYLLNAAGLMGRNVITGFFDHHEPQWQRKARHALGAPWSWREWHRGPCHMPAGKGRPQSASGIWPNIFPVLKTFPRWNTEEFT
jgi:hypothetical protein